MDFFSPARGAVASLPGEVGAFASDEDGQALFCENEDELFPSASVIKLPLVMTLYADATRRLLQLDERVEVGDRVDGSGMLRHLRDVERVSLRDLAMLAIIVSDNTATNRLIERIGIDRVGERLREWGCPESRLSRKMYDFEAARSGHDNVMTARETVSLLLRLQRGECEDRATSDAVLAVLEQCQDRTMLLRYLPDGAKVPHKTGTLDESRNDAAIVPGDRPVIVTAFSRKLRDTGAAISWLGLLGWCAYRAAGNSGDPLPPELTRTA
ncbi:MAG TPA: serine hydrolase [Candidatus Limnocylindria bacterium]|nr:serine hydrolase [Candidatus Limnocylindria bacterium]